jgi:prepilin peptidase CpaA
MLDGSLKESEHTGSPAAVKRSRGCTPFVSVGVAAGVTACLVASGVAERLPALAWAAAYLFFVIEHDVRTLRIPNWLNFSAFAVVMLFSLVNGGLEGLGFALGGAGLAFALLFPVFALGWLGAGDVKAMMVLGALWGGSALPGLLWWMVVVGGGLALALVVVRGGLLDLLRRWGQFVKTLFYTRKLIYIPPSPGTAAAGGLPFAVAMGLGVAAHQLWGAPWA